MVYMAGFNNLSTFATKDLQEMRKVGSTDGRQARRVRQAPGAAVRAPHPRRQERRRARQREAIGDVDSGSPQTMLDFVRWAVKNAPAERYALIVWNHGSGFDVLDVDQLYAEVRGANGQPGVSPREIGVHGTPGARAEHLLDDGRRGALAADAGERAIASDDGTGHSLDTIELNRVVKKVHEEVIGEPLELLGMDACLMSNLEVAYEVEKHAKVVVGSEELEPGDGWPYTKILQDLNKNAGHGRRRSSARSSSTATSSPTRDARGPVAGHPVRDDDGRRRRVRRRARRPGGGAAQAHEGARLAGRSSARRCSSRTSRASCRRADDVPRAARGRSRAGRSTTRRARSSSAQARTAATSSTRRTSATRSRAAAA